MLAIELGHHLVGAAGSHGEDGTTSYFHELTERVRKASGRLLLGDNSLQKDSLIDLIGCEPPMAPTMPEGPGIYLLPKEVRTFYLLPHREGMIDEIIMKDVFGSPVHFEKREGCTYRSNAIGNVSSRESTSLTDEIDRLLVPGGRLVSIETLTPE